MRTRYHEEGSGVETGGAGDPNGRVQQATGNQSPGGPTAGGVICGGAADETFGEARLNATSGLKLCGPFVDQGRSVALTTGRPT
jgi:hypothetical protein